MKERMAPGHVYQVRLGSGIEWGPDRVTLWERGTKIQTARHTAKSPWGYWYSLTFAESFPDVTHWWFRSAWTQNVRLTGIEGLMDGITPWGYMQFINEDEPAHMWTITEGERPEIATPFPPYEVQPVNLPLRLALARLVAGVIADEVHRDTWMLITSLVQRDELEAAFPDQVDALSWKLENVAGSIRSEFCRVQGLKEV